MRAAPRSPSAARPGFTLVELLVAAALSVVIMTILAVAFQTGTETLSQMKSVAGLADQLRSAQVILTRDLGADHLTRRVPDDSTARSVPNSAIGLSEALVYRTGGVPTAWHPELRPANTTDPDGSPRGFFKIVQGTRDNSLPSEGGSSIEPESRIATDHWMQFTARLPGTNPQLAFFARLPVDADLAPLRATAFTNLFAPGRQDVYATNWAEVTYFLRAQTGPPTADFNGTSLPLHTLHRRVRLLSLTPVTLAAGVDINKAPDVAGAGTRVFTPSDIVNPNNRLGGNTLNPPGPLGVALNGDDYAGTDVLLGNVVSFRIQALDDFGAVTLGFGNLPPSPTVAPTLTPPNDYTLPTGGGASTLWFDTAFENNPNNKLRAVRIELRVYDLKNRVTRQASFVEWL